MIFSSVASKIDFAKTEQFSNEIKNKNAFSSYQHQHDKRIIRPIF